MMVSFTPKLRKDNMTDQKLTVAAAYQELEKIAAEFENKELDLETFVPKYEHAVELAKFLKTELNVDKEKLKGEPIDVLSKCWLIARYDDGGLWNKYYKEVSEEIQGKKIRNYFQKKDAEILHEEMIDHLYFLTMPITDEITSYEKTIVMGKNEFSIQSVLLSVDSSYKYSFRTIIDRSKDIEIFSKNYESAKKVLGEKVKYISKILREISENASKINRIQLVMLVSIIEFLLTHDPSDGSEDSISKQFRLKTSILVKDYQGLPIDELGQRLKDIYNLRSKIAHGDFKEVEKCLKKFQSKQIYMCNLIDDLYIYITEILRVYLVEPNYIDYLKKS